MSAEETQQVVRRLQWILKPRQRKCLHQLSLETRYTTEVLVPVLDQLVQEGTVGTESFKVTERPPTYTTGFYLIKR